MQALETELGVPLFDRIGQRMRLTAEGEEVVRRAAGCCRRRNPCATGPKH
jgi:DNA-binding transcriptional LysR family regulator